MVKLATSNHWVLKFMDFSWESLWALHSCKYFAVLTSLTRKWTQDFFRDYSLQSLIDPFTNGASTSSDRRFFGFGRGGGSGSGSDGRG